MSDNAKFVPTPAHPLSGPDTEVNARDVFGIDDDMMVPAFSAASDYVPNVDPNYQFDHDTTIAILAGFAHNRRVIVQGYHGTGKSTHIEQVAARLNWPGPPFLWGDLTLRRASLTIVKVKQSQWVFKAVFAWLACGKFPAWTLPGGRPPDLSFKRRTLQPFVIIP